MILARLEREVSDSSLLIMLKTLHAVHAAREVLAVPPNNRVSLERALRAAW